MKNRVLVSLARLALLAFGIGITVVAFQNCGGGEQTFDAVSTGPSTSSPGECTTTTKTISIISNSEGLVTFELAATNVTETEWSVDGQTISTESGRRFTHRFPRTGNYVVSASAFKGSCLNPIHQGEREISVTINGNVGGSTTTTCPSLLPNLTAQPEANTNNPVVVQFTNWASFEASSIRWTVNSAARNLDNGKTSINLANSTSQIVYDVRVSAIRLACDKQEQSAISVTVGGPVGAVSLNSFNMVMNPIVLAGANMTAVRSVSRGQRIDLNFVATNMASASVSGVPNVCNTTNCLTLQTAHTSATTCQDQVRTLALVGTNGSSLNQSFFLHCPATSAPINSAVCIVGRTQDRSPDYYCPGTETIVANPNPCTLSNGTCSSTLTLSNLDSNRKYKVFRVDGESTLTPIGSCIQSATNSTVALTGITSTEKRYRLYRSVPGANCETPTSLLRPAGSDVLIKGQGGDTGSSSTISSSTQAVTCPAMIFESCQLPRSTPDEANMINGSCICGPGYCDFPPYSPCSAICQESGRWVITNSCGIER